MRGVSLVVALYTVVSLIEGKSKYVSVNLDAKWDSTPMLLEARYCFNNYIRGRGYKGRLFDDNFGIFFFLFLHKSIF